MARPAAKARVSTGAKGGGRRKERVIVKITLQGEKPFGLTNAEVAEIHSAPTGEAASAFILLLLLAELRKLTEVFCADDWLDVPKYFRTLLEEVEHAKVKEIK